MKQGFPTGRVLNSLYRKLTSRKWAEPLRVSIADTFAFSPFRVFAMKFGSGSAGLERHIYGFPRQDRRNPPRHQ